MRPEVAIRRAREEDAEGALRAHRAAVLEKAQGFYPPEHLADWAAPLTLEHIAHQAAQFAREDVVSFVAESNGTIIGFSMLVPKERLLGAIYVAPGPWRGVGVSLLAVVEEEARQRGLAELSCDASLNAESFYRRNGYESLGPVDHVSSRTGSVTPCLRMRKRLS